jgi:multiple sugar transport system permease protein
MTAVSLGGARPREARKRSPRAGRTIKITVGTCLLLLAAIWVLGPLYWLVIASTKSTRQLFATSTFLPPSHLSLGVNLRALFSYESGAFKGWLLNSALYSTLAAGVITAVSTACGYALATYRFRSRALIIGAVLGSLMIPTTALVVPTFTLEHALGLLNTYEGVVLPLAVSPFATYYMMLYAQDAFPGALLDASRIDGAREWTILLRVGGPVLAPGMATLFLLSFVGTWNNYFLPLVLLSDSSRYPLTVGLAEWSSELHVAGVTQPLYPEVLLGSLLSVLPMLLLFPLVQKYVARGLTFGAVTGE